MKNSLLFTLSMVGISAVPIQAAGYISDFSTLSPEDVLDGVDGWTQNTPNDSDIDGVYPWAYGYTVQDGATSIAAAAVGGWYNGYPPTPPTGGGPFYAAHTLSLDKGMLFEMKLAITDSDSFGTQRNSFRISFYDAAYEVFALVFDPNINPENPDPLTATDDTWNVSSSSGGVQTSDIMAIYETQLYTLRLSLLPRAGSLDYFYSFTSDNTANAYGSLNGGLTGQIDSLRVGIDPLDGQFGTNQLVFTGISAVAPEPSSLLLVATAAAGLVLRRRRL